MKKQCVSKASAHGFRIEHWCFWVKPFVQFPIDERCGTNTGVIFNVCCIDKLCHFSVSFSNDMFTPFAYYFSAAQLFSDSLFQFCSSLFRDDIICCSIHVVCLLKRLLQSLILKGNYIMSYYVILLLDAFVPANGRNA